MKIAIITNFWKNSDGGGIREYTVKLVSNLKDEKIEVVVLFREGTDYDNYKLSFNKIRFIIDANKILSKENPDVILCQGLWFTMMPAVIYKKYKNRTKILCLFHTYFDKKFQYLTKMFLQYIINKFDHIGFVSKALYYNIINDADLKIENKIYILYAGIDTIFPTKEEIEIFRKDYNLSQEYIYLLGQGLTAIFAKKEGVKLLMQSLKRIVRKYPKIKLILTRRGIYEKELRNYARKLELSKHVIFTGDLDNPIIATKICDIYTHITYGEGGLSLSILEAMSLGKPILASTVGGIPEAIENEKTGILVNNDINDIYDATINLIENKKFAEKLGNNAMKVAKEKFTWKNTIYNLMKVINS